MSQTNGSGPHGFNPFTDAAPAAVVCPDCGELHDGDHAALQDELEQQVAEVNQKAAKLEQQLRDGDQELLEELEQTAPGIAAGWKDKMKTWQGPPSKERTLRRQEGAQWLTEALKYQADYHEQKNIDDQYWADHRREKVQERKTTGSARFVVRDLDRTRMRPLDWLWRPWIPSGALTLTVGEEGVGKSTLQAYIAAQVTTGQIGNGPADVLFIGADEDDWYEMVGPRLEAAGADLDRVKQFEADGSTAVFNVVDHIDALDFALSERPYALLVVEQLMDVLPAMRSYTDPAALRGALKPLRQVLRRRRTAALATLHMNKGRASSLREAQQGSVQFGAVARSSFLVARHPEDDTRRVVVGGKANYVPEDEKSALSFSIAEHVFSVNGYTFNVGRVAALEREQLKIGDVLRPPSGQDQEREGRLDQLVDVLTEEPQSGVQLAEETGIPQASVYRLMPRLVEEGKAAKTRAGWSIISSHAPRQLRIDNDGGEPIISSQAPRELRIDNDGDAPQNAIFGYEEDDR